MTDNMQEAVPKGCPYIGLVDDRTVMLLEPSPSHGCFSDPDAVETPTLQYQADICLCGQYAQCPRYVCASLPVDEQVPVQAPPDGLGLPGDPAPPRPQHRRWIARRYRPSY
jgi:hypothetical protein